MDIAAWAGDVGADEGIAYSGILCEFLEVAIHLILYIREIYPAAVFRRRRKYNIPVYMCAHPELNEYIRHVLDGIKSLLEAGQVDHIAVVIKNKEDTPVERFMFRTAKGTGRYLSSDSYLLSLEAGLRAMLLKINVSDTLLQPNPPDCTFAVHVCTSEAAAAVVEQDPLHKEFPWIPGEAQTVRATSWSSVPLKSFSNNLLQVKLHVEESVSGKKH